MRPAVFLDRDDTLIVNRAVTAATKYPGSLFDPALVRLAPGAGEACSRLAAAGFALVVVSNQGCVARGECTVEDVEATNRRMCELVEGEAGVGIDGVYYCPHHPRGVVAPYCTEHSWRKPGPGMLLRAVDDLGLDVRRSWMIGDAERDILAAVRAGIPVGRTIVVGGLEGAGAGWRAAGMVEAAAIVLGAS